MSARTSRCVSSAARIRVSARAMWAGWRAENGSPRPKSRATLRPSALRVTRSTAVRTACAVAAASASSSAASATGPLRPAPPRQRLQWSSISRASCNAAAQYAPFRPRRASSAACSSTARTTATAACASASGVGAAEPRAVRVATRAGDQVGARLGRRARGRLRRNCRVLSGHCGPPVLGKATEMSWEGDLGRTVPQMSGVGNPRSYVMSDEAVRPLRGAAVPSSHAARRERRPFPLYPARRRPARQRDRLVRRVGPRSTAGRAGDTRAPAGACPVAGGERRRHSSRGERAARGMGCGAPGARGRAGAVVRGGPDCQLALLHHLVLVDASAVVTQEPVPEQRDFAVLLAGRRRYDRGQAARPGRRSPRRIRARSSRWIYPAFPRKWDPRCGA